MIFDSTLEVFWFWFSVISLGLLIWWVAFGLPEGFRIRIEWKPQDLWVGVFWKRKKWWGGNMDWFGDGQTDNNAHRNFDLWICLVPMLPIHIQTRHCPEPGLCWSGECPSSRKSYASRVMRSWR